MKPTFETHRIIERDGRILDPEEDGKLGSVYAFITGATADSPDKSGAEFLIDRVRPNEAGSTFIRRRVAGPKLNAKNKLSPSIITLVIESTVFDNGSGAVIFGNSASVLQAVLQFGTGSGQQGVQPATALPFAGGTTLDGAIIIDIDSGVLLSFPASYFQIDFLYTAVRAAGWPAAQVLGPNYQVTFSLGYEAQVHTGEVTSTQFLPAGDLVAGAPAATFFARPKYATAVFFQWLNWGAAGFTPLQVDFINGNGTTVWSIPNYSNAVNPPAVLPWPSDAVAMLVTNLSAGLMQFFRAVNILEF